MNRLRFLFNWLTARRSLFIRTEATPNSNALKFIPGRALLQTADRTFHFELRDFARFSANSFADRVFSLSGISDLLIGYDFITVTKSESADWKHIQPQIFSLLTESLCGGLPLLPPQSELAASEARTVAVSQYTGAERETVEKVLHLLDTKIRPSVQQDGGDVDFIRLQDGVLFVSLKGACSSCSSSTITLKRGIEAMMRHYIPEVIAVEQEKTRLEAVSDEQFSKQSGE